MILTDQQHDSLAEMINIAFSRTAASLSDLTGQRVLLDLPQVSIHPTEALIPALTGLVRDDVAMVQQLFSGPLSGDALLLLNYTGAIALTSMLTGGTSNTHRLDASGREVLTEVGNILLNACLGMFGDVLQVRVSFSVPRIRLESLDALLSSIVFSNDDMRHALVIYTNFRVADSTINGYLVIVMGMLSLDRLLQALEELG